MAQDIAMRSRSQEQEGEPAVITRIRELSWKRLIDIMEMLFIGAAAKYKDITPMGLAFSTACVQILDHPSLLCEVEDRDAYISEVLVDMGYPPHEDWRGLVMGITHSARVYPILQRFGLDLQAIQELVKIMWLRMITHEMSKNPDLEIALRQLLDDSGMFLKGRRRARRMSAERMKAGVRLEDITGQLGQSMAELLED